jgi:hypothetical protein
MVMFILLNFSTLETQQIQLAIDFNLTQMCVLFWTVVAVRYKFTELPWFYFGIPVATTEVFDSLLSTLTKDLNVKSTPSLKIRATDPT